MHLILASASPIRRTMLDNAGVPHEVIPSDIDESEIKQRLSDPRMIALELARAKAVAVSRRGESDWVIGSDSIVCAGGRMFAKPCSREEAADHLRFFSTRTIELTSAVAISRDGELEWNHVDTARLLTRKLSEEFIESYLDAEWPAVAGCVGVFRMEGRGIQLFEAVDGSHFTILGMPLLPLLHALRERGLLTS